MGAVQLQSRSEGRVRVVLVAPTVVEITYEGFIDRAATEQGFAEADALLDANPGAHSLLWDTDGLTGYEPGNTAITMKWLARTAQVRRGATVTRSQAIASLVHVARVMVQGYEVQVFRTREEALAWLQSPLTGRPRTRSGRYRRAV